MLKWDKNKTLFLFYLLIQFITKLTYSQHGLGFYYSELMDIGNSAVWYNYSTGISSRVYIKNRALYNKLYFKTNIGYSVYKYDLTRINNTETDILKIDKHGLSIGVNLLNTLFQRQLIYPLYISGGITTNIYFQKKIYYKNETKLNNNIFMDNLELNSAVGIIFYDVIKSTLSIDVQAKYGYTIYRDTPCFFLTNSRIYLSIYFYFDIESFNISIIHKCDCAY